MRTFRQFWQDATGRTRSELHLASAKAEEHRVQAAKSYQLERDLFLAQAAIKDLKSHLPKDYEARRKAASDSLGEGIIADMKANPKKYIPR